jgi:hypothetical protein
VPILLFNRISILPGMLASGGSRPETLRAPDREHLIAQQADILSDLMAASVFSTTSTTLRLVGSVTALAMLHFQALREKSISLTLLSQATTEFCTQTMMRSPLSTLAINNSSTRLSFYGS